MPGCRPTRALIYVDNIRDAFVAARSGQCRRPTRPMPRPTRREIAAAIEPIRARARGHPGGAALAGHQRGRLQLSRPRFRAEGALSLADQRRPAGHAAAGAQGDRRRARATTSRSCSARARSPPKPAQQVARETGAAYGGVLYVDSLSEADGPVPTYLDLLRVTVRDHRQGPRAMNDADATPASSRRAADAGPASPSTTSTVTYRNGHTALRDASFAIPTGTITALVGVNGSRQVDAVQGDHGLRAARRGRDPHPRPAGATRR